MSSRDTNEFSYKSISWEECRGDWKSNYFLSYCKHKGKSLNLWRCVWRMLNDLYWGYNLLLTGAKFAWWLGKSRGQGCLHSVQPVRNHLNSISEDSQNNFLLQWIGIIKLHLWETNSKKELEFYFPSFMLLRGVRMMLKGIRLKDVCEKNSCNFSLHLGAWKWKNIALCW